MVSSSVRWFVFATMLFLPFLVVAATDSGAQVESAAITEDAGAMIQMGDACADAQGRIADPMRQEDWYCRAADAGNPYGLMRLAGFYGRSEAGTAGQAWAADDYGRLAHLYPLDEIPLGQKTAISEGFKGLADSYADGKGRPLDLQMAVKLYRQSAALGNSDAIRQLHLIGSLDRDGPGPRFIPFSPYRWVEVEGFNYDGKPLREHVLQYTPTRSVVIVGDPTSPYAQRRQTILLLEKKGNRWSLLAREDNDTEMSIDDISVVIVHQGPYLFYEWKSCSDCWGVEVRYLGSDRIERLDWDKTLWAHNYAEVQPDGWLRATGNGFYEQSNYEWSAVELAFRLDGKRAIFDRERTRQKFAEFFQGLGVSAFSLQALEAFHAGEDEEDVSPQQRLMCLRMLLEIEGKAIAPQVLRYLTSLEGADKNEVIADAKALLGLR